MSRTGSVESAHGIWSVPLTLEWKSTVSSESVYSLVASANSGTTAFSLVVASAVARYILVNASSGRVGDKGRYGGTGKKGKAPQKKQTWNFHKETQALTDPDRQRGRKRGLGEAV